VVKNKKIKEIIKKELERREIRVLFSFDWHRLSVCLLFAFPFTTTYKRTCIHACTSTRALTHRHLYTACWNSEPRAREDTFSAPEPLMGTRLEKESLRYEFLSQPFPSFFLFSYLPFSLT
jgi:hypothetical protein